MNIWRILIGLPLETEHLKTERLNKRRGLAVLSSDNLSSTAYATEEILRVLILAGAAGLSLSLPISVSIVVLIFIVGLSYYKTIHAYPSGGGAYTVAKENLGTLPSLVAASALLVDYGLTVAVSICAAVAAITSAFPALHSLRIDLAVFFVLLITIINLRGVRESSTVFMIPTYLFIFVFGGMIAYGVYKVTWGDLANVRPTIIANSTDTTVLSSLTLFLVLRAFASGCSALTGIEAVSNGVQAFNPPQAKNATQVLWMMIAFLATFFLGASYLSANLGIIPNDAETVISQVARELFGTNFAYYSVQFVTTIILILAANTAYTGFPRLASILAQDRFLPRQLGNLGDRLVFSNGILVLGIVVSFLVWIFGADTHGLIPLYMVGVFVTFTISQTGMVRFWLRERGKNWITHLTVNGLGAICTAIVGVVVFVVKFKEPHSWEGAWMTLVAISLIVWIMLAIHKHYEEFIRQLSLTHAKPPTPFTEHIVVIPVSDVHRGVLEAVRYAKTLSTEVTALYVDLGNPERTEAFKKNWNVWVPDIPITVLPSPYRSVIKPIVQYLDDLREASGFETAVTVVIPEFVPVKWWHHLLHNQTAFILKFALLFRRTQHRRYKVLADVPYYLRR